MSSCYKCATKYSLFKKEVKISKNIIIQNSKYYHLDKNIGWLSKLWF